jgi:hypothetical protein
VDATGFLRAATNLYLLVMSNLPIDGAEGGLKRGNTPMKVKECYDGREDRSGEKGPGKEAFKK